MSHVTTPLLPQLHMISTGFPQAYLWRDGEELTLIDAGFPGDAPAIAAAIEELGYSTAQLTRLVLTHHHEDHAGAAADIRAWGGVEVIAHRADAPIIRGAQSPPERIMTGADRELFERLSAGIPPAPACRVDTEVVGGDVLPFGGGAIVLSAAGHTDGSIGLFLPDHGVLFTGDLIVRSPAGVHLGRFNDDIDTSRRSFVGLTGADARLVCFGHGEPLADPRAWRALRDAVAGDPDLVPTIHDIEGAQ